MGIGITRDEYDSMCSEYEKYITELKNELIEERASYEAEIQRLKMSIQNGDNTNGT